MNNGITPLVKTYFIAKIKYKYFTIKTNKERIEANGLSHKFQNLVTALPIHRSNDMRYDMTEF